MTPEELYNACLQGQSMESLAKKLKRTRGSVAGSIFAYRQKHKLPGIKVSRKKDDSASPKKKPHQTRLFKGRHNEPRVILDKGNLTEFRDVLVENGCRYIEGDMRAGTATFCEHSKLPGKSYCAEHQALCYRPVRARKDLEADLEPLIFNGNGRFGA